MHAEHPLADVFAKILQQTATGQIVHVCVTVLTPEGVITQYRFDSPHAQNDEKAA